MTDIPNGVKRAARALMNREQPAKPARIEPGHVWLATRGEESRVVVVLSVDERFVDACLVSTEVYFGSDRDLIVRDASILGYEFMIEAWNEVAVGHGSLVRYLGQLPTVERQRLRELCHGLLSGRWPEGDRSDVGPPVKYRSDVRRLFQVREAEAALRLRSNLEPLDDSWHANVRTSCLDLVAVQSGISGYLGETLEVRIHDSPLLPLHVKAEGIVHPSPVGGLMVDRESCFFIVLNPGVFEYVGTPMAVECSDGWLRKTVGVLRTQTNIIASQPLGDMSPYCRVTLTRVKEEWDPAFSRP